MKNEYGKVGGWKAWYDGKRPSEEETALLRGTNQIRVRTEKIEPLKTDSTFAVGIKLNNDTLENLSSSLAEAKGKKIPVKLSGTTSNAVLEFEIAGQHFALPTTEVLVERRLAEFPDKNILKICEHYYRTIATIVDECGKKFDA